MTERARVVGTMHGVGRQSGHEVCQSLLVGVSSQSQLTAVATVADGAWKLDIVVKRQHAHLLRTITSTGEASDIDRCLRYRTNSPNLGCND